MLCERGIHSFDNCTRNVLDLGAVAALRQITHLPVIVYPSHAIGKRELVASMAGAAVACGADGIMQKLPMLEETEEVMRSQISNYLLLTYGME